MKINLYYILLLIIMTLLGSIASFFLKKAADFKCISELIINQSLYIGAGLYFVSALLNIYILRYLDYSVVLPFTSITYVWTFVISHHVLKERIGRKKIIGILGIIFGTVLINVS